MKVRYRFYSAAVRSSSMNLFSSQSSISWNAQTDFSLGGKSFSSSRPNFALAAAVIVRERNESAGHRWERHAVATPHFGDHLCDMLWIVGRDRCVKQHGVTPSPEKSQ
jgi:hypothetical protein